MVIYMAKIKAEILMAVQAVNNVIAPLIHYGLITLTILVHSLLVTVPPDL